jgi:urease accessory protein
MGSVLDRRLFRWPFALTRSFALDSAPAHMLTVIVQSSAGALHGEDRLIQRFSVGADAAAHVTTPAAAVVHRADSRMVSRDDIMLRVETDGYLEYLPEPRILFPGAALDQAIDIDCAPGGIALVSEAFTVHDPAHAGGRFRRLAATTTVRSDGGDAVMIDRLDVQSLGRGRAATFAAFGTVTLFAPGRDIGELANHLSEALAKVPALYGAATALPGRDSGVSVRLAGHDLRGVRAGIGAVWYAVRVHLYGVPPPSRRKDEIEIV